jgi:hypothetical protein
MSIEERREIRENLPELHRAVGSALAYEWRSVGSIAMRAKAAKIDNSTTRKAGDPLASLGFADEGSTRSTATSTQASPRTDSRCRRRTR